MDALNESVNVICLISTLLYYDLNGNQQNITFKSNHKQNTLSVHYLKFQRISEIRKEIGLITECAFLKM